MMDIIIVVSVFTAFIVVCIVADKIENKRGRR